MIVANEEDILPRDSIYDFCKEVTDHEFAFDCFSKMADILSTDDAREDKTAVPMEVERQTSEPSSNLSEALNTQPKIFIILSKSSLPDIEANLQKLMARKEMFEACTFIIEFPQYEPLPSWLEAYNVDYIDDRKEDKWRRIMGSLFGIYCTQECTSFLK